MNLLRLFILTVALLQPIIFFDEAVAKDSSKSPISTLRCPPSNSSELIAQRKDITDPKEIKKELKRTGVPPIYFVLGKNRHAALKTFLAAGGDSNVCILGSSPLAFAATDNDLEEVQILLDGGAHPDTPLSEDGSTPLFAALSFGHFEIAKILLDRGANPLYQSDGGGSVLRELAGAVVESGSVKSRQQIEIAGILLKKGVKVDSGLTARKTTALMYTAINGNIALASFLINNGADVSLVNGDGKTALAFAKKKNNQAMIELLKKAGAK